MLQVMIINRVFMMMINTAMIIHIRGLKVLYRTCKLKFITK